MTDRDRLVRCVLGEPVDRPPFLLYFGPWGSTWARWQREGKPDSVTDARSGFDPDFPPLPLPVNCGPCPPFGERVLEEDARSVISVDRWGITRRNRKHGESMPQFLSFPVKSRRDWEQYREERLDPHHADRLAGEWASIGQAWNEAGLPVQLGYYPDTGLFGGLRWLLGDEECLAAFCTMPDLVHEILDHLTSVWLTVYAQVVRKVRVDVIHFWEDMCGRHGPLIGPQLWREFLGPHYKRISVFARDHGIPILSVDTDGNPDLIIPPMMEAGVNFLWPFEVAAGCDIKVLQARYPALGKMGGIDKRALAAGPKAIDAELARIAPAVAKGRYIPELDHLVPDDVPWHDYCYYVAGLRRLVGKA